ILDDITNWITNRATDPGRVPDPRRSAAGIVAMFADARARVSDSHDATEAVAFIGDRRLIGLGVGVALAVAVVAHAQGRAVGAVDLDQQPARVPVTTEHAPEWIALFEGQSLGRIARRPNATRAVDVGYGAVVGVRFEGLDDPVRGRDRDDVPASVVFEAPLGAVGIALDRAREVAGIVFIAGRRTAGVGDRDDQTKLVHSVEGLVAEPVRDRGDVAGLVIGELTSQPSVVTPGPHAPRVIAQSIVGKIVAGAVALGLADQQMIDVFEGPRVIGGIDDSDEIACAVVLVARVREPAVTVGIGQVDGGQSPGVIVLEFDGPARDVGPAQAPVLVIAQLDPGPKPPPLLDQQGAAGGSRDRLEAVDHAIPTLDLEHLALDASKRHFGDRVVDRLARRDVVAGEVEYVELD